MLIKSDLTTTNSSSIVPVATSCGNCGVEERRLLHHVRHRGIFRRLCTSCVLRLHPQSFCPTCFEVYPPHPMNDAVLTCTKCYSSSHRHCVTGGPAPPSSTYTCPLCLNQNTPIFRLKMANEANSEINQTTAVHNQNYRVMDRGAAVKLLAAAKIASASMNKAAVAAKAEAERRAKEAAFTKKRAKEALEHVAYMVKKENLKKRDAALATPGQMLGPGRVGVGSNVGYPGSGIGRVKMERENNVNVISGNRNGNMAGSLALVVVEEKTNNTGKVGKGDNSNHVLAALDAVELSEKDKMGGITAQVVGSGVLVNDDSTMMDVDDVEIRVEERSNDSGSMESGSKNLNTNGKKPEDVSNLLDQMQYKENNNGEKQQ